MDGWRRAFGEAAGVAARQNEPLARHTTLGIGGPADIWAECGDEAAATTVMGLCRGAGVACRVFGRGSNVLVSDQGLRGVVMRFVGGLGEVVAESGQVTGLSGGRVAAVRVRAGAGASLDAVAAFCEDRGLCGAEFLAGIPGTVGGGLRSNAGAFGRQLSDAVIAVRGVDSEGRVRELGREELSPGYRRPLVPAGLVALSVVLAFLPGRPEPAQAIRERRWERLPSEPSAGSFFRNPEVAEERVQGFEGSRIQVAEGRVRVPAGWLVERCGLKGRRVGDAMVSERHANFIINAGRATCADVLELAEIVKAVVEERTGVRLAEEVELVSGGSGGE